MNRTINNNLTAFPERDLAETSGFVGLLILPKHDERFPASCIVCSSALLLVTSSAHPSCVRIETYRYQLVAATFSWSRLLGHRPRVDFVEKALTKKMFVTGHTGFTGGWVCRWLGEIGSIVAGFSLPPITEPSLFNYDGFSDILVINRSVREPLEEYVFRRLMRVTADPRYRGLVR